MIRCDIDGCSKQGEVGEFHTLRYEDKQVYVCHHCGDMLNITADDHGNPMQYSSGYMISGAPMGDLTPLTWEQIEQHLNLK